MNAFWLNTLILSVFGIGYIAIIFEFYIKVNKTAAGLFIAVICWTLYFLGDLKPLKENIEELASHLSDISQILFFLLGAMTLVEIIDSHKGFYTVARRIHTTSKRKMLWIISFTAFFLSAVLDNLTTTILMISILRKLIPLRKDRFLLSCMVVIAANAGGAWTPIGDVTTTMLWINGQVSSLVVIKEVFAPSLISMLVPLLIFTFRAKGQYPPIEHDFSKEELEPGARLVFFVGLAGLAFVPIFKWLTGMPPFMGMLISLSIIWLVTDIIHAKYEHRQHLRVPFILTKVDVSSILFFLGILLAVGALQAVGILQAVSGWLDVHLKNLALIATSIGFFSAIIDNVPLVAAAIGMYDLTTYPMDSNLWVMIAYAAGTGGSILVIGSSAGVALMGLEKIDFFEYIRKISLPVVIGFLLGMVYYFVLY